jgi:iron(III) transport system substrate-binding protein
MHHFSKFRPNHLIILTASLWLIFLLVACGATDEESDANADSGETFASLEEAARAEGGNLMVYTSMNIDDLEVVLERFEEAYPFVETEYYRAGGDEVIQRALIESQANQTFADVIETQAFEVYRMQEAGLLQPFVAPESAVYPDSAKDPDGFWTTARLITVVIGYNTNLVDSADVPTSWDDLLDPKWQGKMGVEASDIELLANMVNVWGEERTYALWEGIAQQDPAIIDGHTELAELMAAGEFAISPTLYGHRVERLKAQGAPIEWIDADLNVAYTTLVSMVADAPNPATARLFIDWYLSEDGQTAIRDVGRIPARPGIAADPPNLTEGLELTYSSPAVAANYNEYADRWNTIFGLDQ